jgi:hypothetical protein
VAACSIAGVKLERQQRLNEHFVSCHKLLLFVTVAYSNDVFSMFILLLPAGTNVILERQQRLTEEYVPRADLVLFVLSADRPLSESELAFLKYIRQWRKKVVFVVNKVRFSLFGLVLHCKPTG